ncbi:complement C3-like [Corticium candelabrum]|uniref:complement C3-like n=1 Tax=Corticium candelabrum TaxID=121492 RepID=UPI002E27008F|nr:complement C3-like [Corticium candelabrum]
MGYSKYLPLLFFVCSSLSLFSSVHSSPNYLVTLPRHLQCCQPETVLVSAFNLNGGSISAYLQVVNDSGQVITQTTSINVRESNSPVAFNLTLPCQKLAKLDDPNAERYVSIKAVGSGSASFSKATRVAVKASPSLVFVQTDKPVYVEFDEVHIRVAVLGCNFRPCCGGDKECVCDVNLDIRNPQNIIVDRLPIPSCSSDGAIKRKDFKLGPSPVQGDWTIIAKRTCDGSVISETYFEVKNYVLPWFDVNIKAPDYVKVTNNIITVEVAAKYKYGRGVQGTLDIDLGICNETSINATVFKKAQFVLFSSVKLDNGVKKLSFPNGGYLEFPYGKRLCIFVEVVEEASGIKFAKSDRSAVFTDNPIKVDCDLTPPFYRPNLHLKLQVQARYPNGRTVSRAQITVTDANGRNYIHSIQEENRGIADFVIDVGSISGDMEIKIGVSGQALGKVCVFKQFCSLCGGHITVRAKTGDKLQVGSRANFEVIKANSDSRQLTITIVVIARGSIQSSQSVRSSKSHLTSFQVEITPQLANRFCVLAYYMDTCNELVSDVVCLTTAETCANEISLKLKTQSVRPGTQATIGVNVACPNSDVALLAVDKGLYILNSKNILSRDKIFSALDNCSYSCGYTVASSDGMFDVVGLAGMSDASINPRCSCCTSSCRASCMNADDSCGTGRKKRGSELVERLCNEIKRRSGKRSNNVAEYCLDEYKELVKGKFSSFDDHLSETDRRNEAEYKTEHVATYIYQCCIEDFKKSDKARSSRRSGVDNFYELDPSLLRRQTYFPHVWLQDKVLTNRNLRSFNVTVRVPDSNTKWFVYGLAQCCESGFCCHLPFSLKRQEQVSVACTAFNYNKHPTIAGIKLVNIQDDLCTTAGSGEETDWIPFRIEGHDSKTVLIPVIPLVVGTTELTVKMSTELHNFDIVQNITVVPEGVTRESDTAVELDPLDVNMDNSKSCTLLQNPDLRIGHCFKYVLLNGECSEPLDGRFTKDGCCTKQIGNFASAFRPRGGTCERCPVKNETHYCTGSCQCGGHLYSRSQTNFFPVQIPENYIEGSVTAWIGVSGKYFTVGENMEGKVDEIESVESMLKIPGGSGEQSMLTFGPNCAIVTFLNATNPGAVRKHLRLLKDGYNYQLKYRVVDSGGFAVWLHYTPSTWLSSFVLRTMCSAREFVIVDDAVVSDLINFLGTRLENGTFIEPQNVIHREMVGGVQEAGVSMTAYTTMSLLECCRNEEKPTLMNLVCPAVSYMQKEVAASQVNRPYAQAIVYKALIQACVCGCAVCKPQGVCNYTIIDKLKKKLFDKAVIDTDGSMHWEADSKLGNAYWYRKPSAISVEMTAYVLQACLCVGDCKCARSTAKWLNTARNSRGAFISTQDTVVALTALAKFAAGCRVTVLHAPNLCVNVRITNYSLIKAFRITPQNADVMYRVPVPVNDLIRVDTCGSGLGRAVVHYEYNVPGTSVEQCAFDIAVNASEMTMSSLFKPPPVGAQIAFCVRYLGSGCTTMAVVELELPTGYEACESLENGFSDWRCLSTILRDGGSRLGLSKYEVSERKVVFYFDKLCDTKRTCVVFKAYRKFEIVNSLPVSVRVFDYYQPDVQCTRLYTLGGGSPELSLICDSSNKGQPACVCGAGRCPKLEKKIHNRLCNACIYHDYVYNVRINDDTYENGWHKFDATVVDEIKPGARRHKNGSNLILWVPSICTTDIKLVTGNCYHIQGKYGTKFVLDHNTAIEQCPKDTSSASDCKNKVKQKCVQKPCKKQKTKKKISNCEKKRMEKCKDEFKACTHVAVFKRYVKKLRDGSICQSRDVCSSYVYG